MLQVIIVSGPVIIENNKVLLNKDEKDNFWKFCGGKMIAEDANLKETAKREVREEMGIDIEISDNKPYFFYVEKERAETKISVVLVHFLASRIGEIVPGDDTKEWGWKDIDSLDQEVLAPNIKPTLEYFGFLK